MWVRRTDINHCKICNAHWLLFLCLKASPVFILERQATGSFITLSTERERNDKLMLSCWALRNMYDACSSDELYKTSKLGGTALIQGLYGGFFDHWGLWGSLGNLAALVMDSMSNGNYGLHGPQEVHAMRILLVTCERCVCGAQARWGVQSMFLYEQIPFKMTDVWFRQQ